MQERLQKYLANAGVASRRKCEEYILQGKVKVNGETITNLGVKVDSAKDKIEFKGKAVKPEENRVYILLHKPVGYITTSHEQFGRHAVLELTKDIKEKIVPVGRLDKDTSGALLLSNDGDFVYKATHPKHNLDKTYIVKVEGKVNQKEVEKLRKGIKLSEFSTSPAKVEILKTDEPKATTLRIIIHEGKNRQIRRMCDYIGHKVIALHRQKIGNIDVNDIQVGKYRHLTESEINQLIK